MDVIRRQPEDIDENLIQALLPLGEKAVDGLLALYEELGEEQGSDLAFLLAGLRIRDPECWPCCSTGWSSTRPTAHFAWASMVTPRRARLSKRCWPKSRRNKSNRSCRKRPS